MNGKKIIFFAAVAMITLSSLAMVSAGLFDFGNEDTGDANITINATTHDKFIFFSDSSSETNSTCWCAVIVNGTTYYVPSSTDEMSDLIDYSPNFKDAWAKSFSGFSKDHKVPVDRKFSFKCEHAEVGSNNDTYVITELYLPDD